MTNVGNAYNVAISHGKDKFLASEELICQLAANGQLPSSMSIWRAKSAPVFVRMIPFGKNIPNRSVNDAELSDDAHNENELSLFPSHTITEKNKKDLPMKETKPNTPAEFTVQSQDISDEELDAVADGVAINAEDILIAPTVARVYF